jgi:ATP-binding cassette subfamily C protein LapB
LAAAEKTGLNNLINSAPKGLDTIIPEGGNTLSGGQKQLIAITRLLLANPSIWLLDEPTANMDDFTENKIINVLNSQITPDKTLILVTHKPALLALVNRVIVLAPQGIAMDGPKNLVLEKLSGNQKNKNIAKKTTESEG